MKIVAVVAFLGGLTSKENYAIKWKNLQFAKDSLTVTTEST